MTDPRKLNLQNFKTVRVVQGNSIDSRPIQKSLLEMPKTKLSWFVSPNQAILEYVKKQSNKHRHLFVLRASPSVIYGELFSERNVPYREKSDPVLAPTVEPAHVRPARRPYSIGPRSAKAMAHDSTKIKIARPPRSYLLEWFMCTALKLAV